MRAEPTTEPTMDPTTKAHWRAAVLAARRTVSTHAHAGAARALGTHLLRAVPEKATVCAYVPVGTEPGSLHALDALVRAAVRVLLPMARHVDGTPQPLDWGVYRPGRLVDAPFGLREPDGAALGAEAIAAASVVLVPALAVDRGGTRLGRGAGFYDRSLRFADPSARLVAVVRDEELVTRLPGAAHDVPMTHALTPGRGWVVLRPSERE